MSGGGGRLVDNFPTHPVSEQLVSIVDFSLTADQQNIRDAILKHCSRFPDEYWLEHDREGVFPHDFYQSLLEAGWLGIAMPRIARGRS